MSTEIQYTPRQIRNFTRRVNKRGPDDCWEWIGLRGDRGHGRINFDHVVHQAHRVAWELANGPIPPGLVVRHKCDFAPCCNPAHLELGTRAENNHDRHIGGRRPGAPNAFTPVTPTREERFYAMVSKTPTETGCLEWLGAHGPSNHGRFGIGGKKVVLAHRYAWELVHGPIPPGKKCLHKCDNPRCVNVSHLWLGTQADNVRDMYEKGREKHTPSPGERNGFSKLTTEQVLEIRGLKHEGWTGRAIAARFEVSASLISSILRRQSWKHI